MLAVFAALAKPAARYLVDEPTARLDERQVQSVRERLRELGSRARVIVATHNRRDRLALGGYTALLAGGSIAECAETGHLSVVPPLGSGKSMSIPAIAVCCRNRGVNITATASGGWCPGCCAA